MKSLKLAIIIPCLNEAQSLPLVLKAIPRKIKGVAWVKTIVVDDGSFDQTGLVAKKAGADYLVSHPQTLGLSKTFLDGLDKALAIGAEAIVNLDGDNQYDPLEIKKLIQPILKGEAAMVLGNRQIKKLKHMPWAKKTGNYFGSWVIRKLTGSSIQDASTGFRALTKELAVSFDLIAGHTYTHETIIHACFNHFPIVEIPVKFRKRETGSSRLITSFWGHIKTSGAIIVRAVLIYKAFKYLTLAGLGAMGLGFLGGLRFLWFYFNGEGDGHVQSLIFSSIFLSLGFSTIVMGVLADLIGINRKLIKKT